MKNHKSTQLTDHGEHLTWDNVHFMHLLCQLSRQVIHEKSLNGDVFKMFERASVSEKGSVLMRLHRDRGKDGNINEVKFIWGGEIEVIALDKINDIIKKLLFTYTQSIVTERIHPKVTDDDIILYHYGAYHFFDLCEDQSYFEGLDITIPEETESEGIISLLNFITLSSDFEHPYRKEIMATSELKANLFLPALEAWFKDHDMSFLTFEEINKGIEKCNQSAEYWDKTDLNAQRKYAEGAHLVKEFLENLKVKMYPLPRPLKSEERRPSKGLKDLHHTHC